MIIKLIYTLFLGILIAIFVGVGIAAFYPAPKAPENISLPKLVSPPPTDSKEYNVYYQQQKQEDIENQKMWDAYNKQQNIYQRNVSVIALISAIIVLVVSLTFFKSILVIADGLLLGGVFTLIYSIGRGFETQDNMFRFLVTSVGLITALTLGYIKFIKPATNK